MTYFTFKNEVVESVRHKIPEADVALHPVLNNNNVSLDALTIQENGISVSPTVYMNYYYEEYQSGVQLNAITNEIVFVYQQHKAKNSMDLSFFTDYNKVKKMITFKVINYKKNFELLKDVSHIKVLDLAIVFQCMLTKRDSFGMATILIHNNHMEYWNVDSEDLYKEAMANMPRLLPIQLENIKGVIEGMMKEEVMPELGAEDMSFPMYVLTNSQKLNGASCILYDNILSNFADTMQSDIYIIPSSIHETILIPANYAPSEKELSDMVKEVNATQVLEEEILSDHVYFFSREKKALLM